MQKYYIGAKPYLEVKCYDSDGALATPGTAPTVTVYDPNGKAVVDDQSTTEDDTGIYYYDSWEVTSSVLTGKYRWSPKVVDSAHATASVEGEFEVILR